MIMFSEKVSQDYRLKTVMKIYHKCNSLSKPTVEAAVRHQHVPSLHPICSGCLNNYTKGVLQKPAISIANSVSAPFSFSKTRTM